METPGVTVRPIKLISGSSPFCETFFDDVRVPVKNVVGKVNGGWTVAKALLGHERTMIADAFGAGGDAGGKRSALAASRASYLGERRAAALADPVLRDQIAQLEMDKRAFDAHPAALARRREGRPPARPGELDLQGLRHRAEQAPPRADGADRRPAGARLGRRRASTTTSSTLTRDWLRSRGNSIEGGTSEVQLNIIAKRVLGLPD